MTKVTGIDIGGAGIRLVELDGSARRFKVSSIYTAARIRVHTAASEEDTESVVSDLSHAFRTAAVTTDRTLYAVPGARCVLRNIVIPFKGVDEIRKVLKYEAESHIHSHSIDEVVVDGTVVCEKEGGTELFVVACPKAFLGPELKALATVEVEPEIADLDASLLVSAANSLGVFDAPVAAPVTDDEEPADESENSLMLGIEADSVLMVMIRDGALQNVRVLRWGFGRLARTLAERIGRSSAEVLAALQQRFAGDEWADASLSSDELSTEQSTEQGTSTETATEEVSRAQPSMGDASNGDDAQASDAAGDGDDEFVMEDELAPPGVMGGATTFRDEELREVGAELGGMIVREIYRFISGLGPNAGPARILLTGSGAMLPNLAETIHTETETDVEILDLMGRADDAAAPNPRPDLDLAYAAAMACLGASSSVMNFRQEDLAFKRRFDRLKFPLAVCALLAAFTLFFMDMILLNNIRYGKSMLGSINLKKSTGQGRSRKIIYNGIMSALGNPGLTGQIKTHLAGDAAIRLLRYLPNQDTVSRISRMQKWLDRYRGELEKRTGYFPELKLESGLALLVPLSEAIDKADKNESIGRFVILSIDLLVGTREANRYLKFKVGFYEGDPRMQNAAFKGVFVRELVGDTKPFSSVVYANETATEDGYEWDYHLRLQKDNVGIFQPPPKTDPAPGRRP